MARKKPNPVDAARQAALRGEVDAAQLALQQAAAAGDDSAAASLAELLAFLWRWEEAIPNAARLIANPYAVYAGNVFDDMVRLLGRAGHHTGAWGQIGGMAAAALGVVERRLQENEMDFPAEKIQAERRRLGNILGRLAEYADRQGRPLHELIRVFSAPTAPDEAGLLAALDKNRGKPASRLLSLAIAFRVDTEAIRLYPEAGNLAFDDAVFVAQALVRSGERGRAWEVVESRLTGWSPVDAAQVAPVVLLVDEELSQIVTPDRAAQIIRTPRG